MCNYKAFPETRFTLKIALKVLLYSLPVPSLIIITGICAKYQKQVRSDPSERGNKWLGPEASLILSWAVNS
jgi:hypothetical protein